MDGRDPREESRYTRSVDEVPPEDLEAIRENIRWFLRFTPRQRLRIAQAHAAEVLRLRRMRRVGRGT